MATGGVSYPIWDRRNRSQQKLVHGTSYSKRLREAGVVLRRDLQTDDVLPQLLQLDVLDSLQMEDLTHNAPRKVIVDRLLAFIHTCMMWQFHGLLRSFALTGQQHLIREVGLNPCHYITAEEEARLLHSHTEGANEGKSASQQPERSSTHDSSQQETMPAKLLKAIVHHCTNCKRCLMRRNLYDFGNKDAIKVVDTAKCYINIDPLREGEHGKMIEISEKEVLLALPGEEHPHVIRLEGQPGVGKTALTHHIVYDWSVELLKRVGEAIPIKIGGDILTTIVHIPARTIKTTVVDAIYDNLRCPKEEKPILGDHVIKGNGTAIQLDGIDEVRDEKVMENIQQYIKERQMSGDGPIVLVTARTDLCPIDIQDIDRFVSVKGFTTDQGISYIKAYMMDHPLCQKVLDFVDAHKQKLFAVITNPLRLHIFCALVSEGELELDKDDEFSILKLFTHLEKCLIKREGKKVTEDELHKFYHMCFFALLKGLREFSKEILEKFHIVEACYIFFAKTDVTTALDKHASYAFPHEMMFEFFAGRYMETLSLDTKKALLLSVCCKPALRNLQKIMFEVILQQQLHQEELLLLMLRSTLIFQHDHPVGILHRLKRILSKNSLLNELAVLKSKVRAPESIEDLLREHQHPSKAKRTNDICHKINSAFDDDPHLLQRMNWYQGLGNGVFGHLSDCLQACNQQQREALASKSTERLLPYTYEDIMGKRHMVHAVEGSRWAKVVYGKFGWQHVYGWCPGDIQEVMYKVRTSGFTYSGVWLGVHLNKCQDTWGQPDSSAYSTRAWNQLYEEVKQGEGTVCKDGVTSCDLYLTPSTPLHGLLQSDLGDILHYVWYGTVGLQELYQIIHTDHLPYTQGCMRGDCILSYTTIVVAEGTDKALLTNMKDQLMSNKKPKLHNPKFVNTTGEVYNWS